DEIALHGTNPLATDSDGDGLSDGDEVTRFHSDPTKQDAHGVFIHVSDNGGTDAADALTRPVTQATKASHPLVSRIPVKMAESAPALMTLDWPSSFRYPPSPRDRPTSEGRFRLFGPFRADLGY